MNILILVRDCCLTDFIYCVMHFWKQSYPIICNRLVIESFQNYTLALCSSMFKCYRLFGSMICGPVKVSAIIIATSISGKKLPKLQ